MTRHQPSPKRLIPDHRRRRKVLPLSVPSVPFIACGSLPGRMVGPDTSMVAAGIARQVARHFEAFRMAVDAQAGRVDDHRRTGTHGGTRRPVFRRARQIPEGAYADPHALNPFDIPGRVAADLARAENPWLNNIR